MMVPLVIFGIIPVFGPMKQALRERAAQKAVRSPPPGSEKIDIRAGADPMLFPPILKVYESMFVTVAIVLVRLHRQSLNFDMQLERILGTLASTFVLHLVPWRRWSPEDCCRCSFGRA